MVAVAWVRWLRWMWVCRMLLGFGFCGVHCCWVVGLSCGVGYGVVSDGSGSGVGYWFWWVCSGGYGV